MKIRAIKTSASRFRMVRILFRVLSATTLVTSERAGRDRGSGSGCERYFTWGVSVHTRKYEHGKVGRLVR